MIFPATQRLNALIELALDEDQAKFDITANCTIPEALTATAIVHAKEELVVCGLPIINLITQRYGCTLALSILQQEGTRVVNGCELARLAGNARVLLALERTILNFLQRLCGVATNTNNFVRHAGGIELLDTRKTLPGWRELDKYATRVGGARNHRADLKSMVLIKNNHIDANRGDVSKVLRAVQNCGVPIEVEVRNLTELHEVLKGQIDYLMLDNMSNQEIAQALALVQQIKPQVKVEVSGGVTLERLPQLAALGVSLVSIGALTTQARNVDISMGIKLAS